MSEYLKANELGSREGQSFWGTQLQGFEVQRKVVRTPGD